MDGLSAAASGMAVVSLAIQLANFVREIQRFMHGIFDARTELKRLIGLLDQLELILESIGSLIDKQEGYMTDANITSNILRAMKTCEDKLSILGNVVESAKKASISKSKVVQSLGLYQLTWKKKDIEDFENELQRVLSILDLTMTMNLTAIHTRSTSRILAQLEAFGTREIPISRNDLRSSKGGMKDSVHIRPTFGHQSSIKTVASTTTYIYRNVFGTVFTRMTSQSIDSSNRKLLSHEGFYIKNKTTWTFLPSFLSLCIEIQYTSTCGSIQRSFRTYPLVRDDHPIWRMGWIKQLSISDFQALLTSGAVSPFSVDSRGSTLLHCAAEYMDFEKSKILLEIGLTGDEVDNCGRQPSQCLMIWPSTLERTKNILHLFKSLAYRFSNGNTSEHCVSPELFSLRNWFIGLDEFNCCVDECVSAQNINDFKISPILIAVERMRNSSDFESRRGWRSAIQSFIAMGADVHAFDERKQSLLDEIVLLADDSFDSSEVGAEWLDILREAGVDVAQYLRTELTIHENISHMFCLEPPSGTLCKKRLIISNDATTGVSWDWLIDSKAHAYEVLNEFKYLEWGDSVDYIYGPIPVLKMPPVCRSYEQVVEARRLAETRFERRQRKNASTIARAQSIQKGPKVPGGWVE